MQLDSKPSPAVAPLWRLAFRPFFLGGSLFAALAIPLWIAAWIGGWAGMRPTGGWLAWHRHEMMFGFGGAIVAGFLLTAIQAWTGRPTLTGRPLMLLAALWLGARISWLVDLPLWLLAPMELGFFLVLALQMGRLLWAVRQRRNYPIVLVLLLMSAADAQVLAGLALADDALQRQGVLAGLWLVAALMVIIGGRVIPFFTQRGLGRAEMVQPLPWLDVALLVATALTAVLHASGLAMQPSPWLAALYLTIAAGHLWRQLRWYDAGIWQVPLLWSLHLAMLWLVVALAGQALWHLGLLASASPSLHALTVGAMGGLILAMLARVTLGHTGRALIPPRAAVVAFVLLNSAAAVRLLLPGFAPIEGLWLAAIGWSLAFALYLWRYAPMLLTPRVDGLPG